MLSVMRRQKLKALELKEIQLRSWVYIEGECAVRLKI